MNRPATAALVVALVLALSGGCAETLKEFASSDPGYDPVYGIEVEGPLELRDALAAAWPAFSSVVGVNPPFRVVHEDSWEAAGEPCAGWYNDWAESIHVLPPYDALPHELAHHAMKKLRGSGWVASDPVTGKHYWPPDVRAALNAAANAIGMGREDE